MGLFAAGLVTLLHRLGGTADAARVAEQWWPALILLLIAHRACTFLVKPVQLPTRSWLPLSVLALATVATAVLLLITTGVLPGAVLLNYTPPVALLALG